MENVKVTNESVLISHEPEGLHLDLDLRGAAVEELIELADWLDARGWDEEAAFMRAGVRKFLLDGEL